MRPALWAEQEQGDQEQEQELAWADLSGHHSPAADDSFAELPGSPALSSRRNAGYCPALPTVTRVSPRSIESPGCAPVTGSGWRRIAMIVMPVLARKPHSASVLPIQGLSSGTGIHSIWSSPSAISRSSTIFGRS